MIDEKRLKDLRSRDLAIWDSPIVSEMALTIEAALKVVKWSREYIDRERAGQPNVYEEGQLLDSLEPFRSNPGGEKAE